MACGFKQGLRFGPGVVAGLRVQAFGVGFRVGFTAQVMLSGLGVAFGARGFCLGLWGSSPLASSAALGATITNS